MISEAAQPKRQDAPWRKTEELILSRKDDQMDLSVLVGHVGRSSDTDTKSF